jgi:hypothetical protein
MRSPVAAYTDTEVSRCGDDEYDGDHEVENLYDIVKRRELVFQEKYDSSRYEAAEPGAKKGNEASSVKQAVRDPLYSSGLTIGMRLSHPVIVCAV